MVAPLRVSGKMGSDMGWVWRHAVVGCTVASGRKDSRDGTVYDSLPLRMQNTKEHGPTDYKMDMVAKHMLMEVRRYKYIVLAYRPSFLFSFRFN